MSSSSGKYHPYPPKEGDVIEDRRYSNRKSKEFFEAKQKNLIWTPDAAVAACFCCRAMFSSWSNRKHHCRSCGKIICQDCSYGVSKVPYKGYEERVGRCCKKELEVALGIVPEVDPRVQQME